MTKFLSQNLHKHKSNFPMWCYFFTMLSSSKKCLAENKNISSICTSLLKLWQQWLWLCSNTTACICCTFYAISGIPGIPCANHHTGHCCRWNFLAISTYCVLT